MLTLFLKLGLTSCLLSIFAFTQYVMAAPSPP